MLKHTYNLFFSIVINMGFVFTQTVQINGIVLERDSYEPIPGVNVMIDGTEIGAASQMDGSFSFMTSQPFPLIIIATHIAYNSENIMVENDSALTVYMSPSIIKGQEIEVREK